MAVIFRLKVDVCTEPNRLLVQYETMEEGKHPTGEQLLTMLYIMTKVRQAIMEEKYRIDQTGTIVMEIPAVG